MALYNSIFYITLHSYKTIRIMKLLNFYRYLYYMLYSWNLKTWGEDDVPEWNALFGVSAMMYWNFGLFPAAILDRIGILPFLNPIPKKEIIIVTNIILIINYFWLVRKGKYKQIAEEYKKDETKKQRRKNALLLWLYVIVSFILPFIVIKQNVQ